MTESLFPNQIVDHCESTNDLARKLGEAGYPHGTWVSARSQGAGRGRLGRKWESSEGNLFLSLLFRSEDKPKWSWVPLATAVGAADALLTLCPDLDIHIKWPNDLWIGRGIDGAKVGGVLCEAVGNRSGSFIVIGIGLNCSRAPEGLDQKTAALKLDVNEVCPVVLRGILGALDELLRNGPSPLAQRFEERAALARGTKIEWGTSEQGEVLGLGQSGELKVQLDSGEEKSLYAEDVKVRTVRTTSGGSRP